MNMLTMIAIPDDRHPPMYINECLFGCHGEILKRRVEALINYAAKRLVELTELELLKAA